MTQEIVRALVDGVWVTEVASQGGGGGGISEITSDDHTVTVTNPSGPTVDLSASGGSPPDPIYILSKAERVFQETAGAGTYTATVLLPAGARVLGVVVFPTQTGAWDADTAVLDIGDTPEPVGYMNAATFGANDANITGPYDPTNPGTNHWAYVGSTTCAYDEAAQFYYPSGGFPGVAYPAGDTVTITLVTTGAGGTNGRLLVDVIGFGVPPGTANAVKT